MGTTLTEKPITFRQNPPFPTISANRTSESPIYTYVFGMRSRLTIA
ncbi:hypothetical protein MC7420_2705 [Coleofasciculus chthonoplastes PCC 7420]|uniref:Uncharacterized protein n=1 Tax=Coleofasciculus chthonoplastes PCC 7420 TaxID=118168 RepID=B4VYG0_9CYAN|nr:hypothetical protein MC7420_2705 [Coleofasciculus chthonoplastes PCC 7420]